MFVNLIVGCVYRKGIMTTLDQEATQRSRSHFDVATSGSIVYLHHQRPLRSGC